MMQRQSYTSMFKDRVGQQENPVSINYLHAVQHHYNLQNALNQSLKNCLSLGVIKRSHSGGRTADGQFFSIFKLFGNRSDRLVSQTQYKITSLCRQQRWGILYNVPTCRCVHERSLLLIYNILFQIRYTTCVLFSISSAFIHAIHLQHSEISISVFSYVTQEKNLLDFQLVIFQNSDQFSTVLKGPNIKSKSKNHQTLKLLKTSLCKKAASHLLFFRWFVCLFF